MCDDVMPWWITADVEVAPNSGRTYENIILVNQNRVLESVMKADDLFHVGIVTDDLDATRAQLSALLHYEWGPEIGAPIEVTLADGPATVEITCAYSTTTPRLEVIRSVPGTFWETVGGSGLHHVGYWSDDVGADAAELERLGYVTEATRSAPDGSPFFVFMRSDTGFRMELVTRAAEPSLRQCWADRS